MSCHPRLGRETTACVPLPCPNGTCARRGGVATYGLALAPTPRRRWRRAWPLPRPSGRYPRSRGPGGSTSERWCKRLQGLGAVVCARAVGWHVASHVAGPRPARDAPAVPRATAHPRLGAQRLPHWDAAPTPGRFCPRGGGEPIRSPFLRGAPRRVGVGVGGNV